MMKKKQREAVIRKIEEKIRAHRRVMMDELHEQCSEVSRTVLYGRGTEILGYRKLCARWVPKMPSDGHSVIICRALWRKR
jgi:hypothetical protein